jgi:uncharacterized membrane protein
VHLIYLSLTVGLILFNLTGVTACAARLLPAVASARLLGVLGLCLSAFCIEHFVGFGRLVWLWPLTTVVAAWAIHGRRDLQAQRPFWAAELVFLLGFAYGLGWRFAFPDIDSGSEHLTDLSFIANYLPGQTLPPPDRWLAGNVFDFYYAFQHYAAALLARLFGLEAGLAMNLAWALMIGFLTSLGWEIASHFIRQRWLRTVLLATLLLGGNGLSPLMPLMVADSGGTDASMAAVNRLWESTRFAGMYDDRVDTDFGRAVAGDPRATDFAEHRELPLETVAYLSTLGDYHPPLGGFVLLLWTLALTLRIARGKQQAPSGADEGSDPQRRENALAGAALGSTAALALATNAWVFPLQCLLLLSWLLFRRRTLHREWPWLLTGALAGMAMIYPFLSHFAPASLAAPIAWVKSGDHTPLPYFLALHWPSLLLIASGLALARRVPWAGWLATTLAGLLLVSELIFVDDPLGGKYERFNTTLKWWSWLWPATLIGLGSVLLGEGGRIGKWLGGLLMAALLVYALPLAEYWVATDKPSMGQMAGNGWLRRDEIRRNMLAHLKSLPDGVVLESVEQGAYSPSSALALNAGKGVVLGWPDHEMQWRGSPDWVSQRLAAARAFYRAQLPEPLAWLRQVPVRYIVWSLDDEQRVPGARRQLQAAIERDYHWRTFYRNGELEAGIWELRTAP